MGNRVESSRDDTPATLDDTGSHLIDESQSPENRVCSGDSPVIIDEVDRVEPRHDGTPDTLDMGDRVELCHDGTPSTLEMGERVG